MNWFNNLLTLATTTSEQPVSNEQFIWLILAGLFLVVLIAVIIAVASTSAASAAIADTEDSQE